MTEEQIADAIENMPEEAIEQLRDLIKLADEEGLNSASIDIARKIVTGRDELTMSLEDTVAKMFNNFGVKGVEWVGDDGNVEHALEWGDEGNVKRGES